MEPVPAVVVAAERVFKQARPHDITGGQYSHPRVLVIAPHNSYRIAPFLSAAQRLNLDVLVASQGEHSIVSAYAQGLHIDLANTDAAVRAIVAEARRQTFAAIVGTDDATLELAARAAQALSLPHNPPAAMRLARRKDWARLRLAQAEVPIPYHRRVDLFARPEDQWDAAHFPCVLKPIAMSASRGVIRANNRAEFVSACARIKRIIATESDEEERRFILAEEFIPGVEVAVEAILNKGALTVLAIFDKPDPLDGPFFEETYYVMPSRLDAATQEQVHAAVAAACHAYGLREGPIHAECRINARGVWILEVAARTIGGLCARLLQVGTGIGLEELVLMQALGQPLPIEPTKGAAGVLMIPIPKAGILRRVEGVIAAERVPYVTEVLIYVREGYELVPLPEGASYLGFIYARAPTPAAAEHALRQAHACLNVVVAPLWKGTILPASA